MFWPRGARGLAANGIKIKVGIFYGVYCYFMRPSLIFAVRVGRFCRRLLSFITGADLPPPLDYPTYVDNSVKAFLLPWARHIYGLGLKIIGRPYSKMRAMPGRLKFQAAGLYFSGSYARVFDIAAHLLSLDPRDDLAALLLAHSALRSGRVYEAVNVMVRDHSSYAVALAAILLVKNKDIDAAVKIILAHVEKSPEDAEAAGEYLLLICNCRPAAMKAYDAALAREPENRSLLFKRALALPLALSTEEEIDLARAEIIKYLSELRAKPVPSSLRQYYEAGARISLLGTHLDFLYPLMYHCQKDIEIIRARADCFLANFPDLRFTAPARSVSSSAGNDLFSGLRAKVTHKVPPPPAQNCRIKIGLFCECLYPQVDIFWAPMLEHLPKSRYNFSLFMPKGLAKYVLPRLKNLADQVIEYPYLHSSHYIPAHKTYGYEAFTKTRQIIADSGLDIFYNLFIGQDMMAQFLSYARLAPVQITDGSRLTTTGMPEVDYYLIHKGDFRLNPDEYFTEKLGILGGITPVLRDMLKNTPAVSSIGRKFFNIPENITIYMCIQDLTRRHPVMNNILAELLRNDPASLLIVSDYGTPGVFNNFIQNLGNLGLRYAAARIIRAPFLGQYPKNHFYAYLKMADANLAYRGMCGGTLFYEQLVAHIPQIIWPYDHISNAAARIYQSLGLEELLADSAGSYVDLAIRLAHDKKWKTELTMKLACKLKDHLKIWEKENAAGDLDTFLTQALDRARAGLPPAHWHKGRFYDQLTTEQMQALNFGEK